MTIILPGAMFAAGVSLYLFHRFNQVNRGKQEERRESLNDTRQRYLQQLIDAKKKEAQGTKDQPAPKPRDGEAENDNPNST